MRSYQQKSSNHTSISDFQAHKPKLIASMLIHFKLKQTRSNLLVTMLSCFVHQGFRLCTPHLVMVLCLFSKHFEISCHHNLTWPLTIANKDSLIFTKVILVSLFLACMLSGRSQLRVWQGYAWQGTYLIYCRASDPHEYVGVARGIAWQDTYLIEC